jgi:hypothetical protein
VVERRRARQKLQSLEYAEIGPQGSGNGGFLLDLSEDGAAVQMAHPALLDDEVDLRFSLGAAGVVQARGRIAWRDKSGKTLGVSFTNLDDPTRARITQWLAENQNIPNYEWSVPSASGTKTRGSPSVSPVAAPTGNRSHDRPANRIDSLSTQPASVNQSPDVAAPAKSEIIASPAQHSKDHPPEVPAFGPPDLVAEQTAARQTDQALELPAPESNLVPGEARFINITAAPRPIHHPAFQPAPIPAQPTAVFVSVAPVNSVARRIPPSPALMLAGNSVPDSLSAGRAPGLVNAAANPAPSASADSPTERAWPASTPYFSLDSAASVAPSPAPGAPPASGVLSWPVESTELGSATSSGASNGEQLPGNRLLLQNAVAVGVPVLIIVLGLGYWMVHSGPSEKSRTASPIAVSQSPQQSSSPVASPNAVPVTPPQVQRANPAPPSTGAKGANRNMQPGAASQPTTSPYDEFSSLYPPPLGTSHLPSGGTPPVVSSPHVSAPPSSPNGKRPSSAQAATSAVPAATSGAPNSDVAPGSQLGGREYANGTESLEGKGDTPGSSAAATYFWEAVRDGNVAAEVALAQLYLRGDGVTRDCEQARALLDAAVSRGNTEAPRILASMSSYGCGPPPNKRP